MTTIAYRLLIVLTLCIPGLLYAQPAQQGGPPAQQGGPPTQQGGPPTQQGAPPTQQSGPTRDNSKFVVFLHVGGKGADGNLLIDDKGVKSIAIALLSKQFVVRAPDWDNDEVGGPGVDYFAESSLEAAKEVAAAVNAKLKELKLNRDGKELMPRLQRVNNPPSYLGVWLF
jgi:hypothetical protein